MNIKIKATLFVLLFSSTVICAQQPAASTTALVVSQRRRACCAVKNRPVSKAAVATSSPVDSPVRFDFFVGEARVEVTKDETVVRLAMAQHASVLIELPANDGPRYIIPGDPELATVDQKALERNKRAIVVRPGAQFLPPLRKQPTRSPAATVTAQMRSGLVVTFLFYPVEDLAQNVHRCVLTYNRDEVVARRRAAGLPVNLEGSGEKGELQGPNAAALSSISVGDNSDQILKGPPTEAVITNASANAPTLAERSVTAAERTPAAEYSAETAGTS